eukprot:393868-Rhodomonas_salina.1
MDPSALLLEWPPRPLTKTVPRPLPCYALPMRSLRRVRYHATCSLRRVRYHVIRLSDAKSGRDWWWWWCVCEIKWVSSAGCTRSV